MKVISMPKKILFYSLIVLLIVFFVFIGINYFYYDDTKKEKQIELFEKQLELAVKYDMPVVIHSRDATKDTIKTERRRVQQDSRRRRSR